MNKKVLLGIVLAVLLIGGGAFAFVNMNKNDVQAPSVADINNTNQANQDSNMNEAAIEENDAAPMTATIVFTSEGFTPSTLTVKKGATITVKNESSDRVQFSSDDHPTHRENTEMNLKTLAPGESGTYTAETVGVHGFHDHIDDSKTGTLTVVE